MTAPNFKRRLEQLWYARGRLPLLSAALPWRLPYGGWWLAHPDAMGARVVGYRWMGHPYEEGQWKFVRRHLGPGMVFLDVGANQGFYSILASRQVASGGRVLAFEPAPTEARKLAANLRLNRCSNVTVLATAVGAAAGRASFHLALGHQGSWSSLRSPADDVTAGVKLIEVDVTTIDSAVEAERVSRVDILKIDAEGGELDVLRGSQTVLRRHRPLVLCEIEDRRSAQWGHSSQAVLDFMVDLGYSWQVVDGDGRTRAGAATGDWTMAVAVPRERVSELVDGDSAMVAHVAAAVPPRTPG